MMLGFVVRQCAVELGHTPDAAEFVEWANNRSGFKGSYRVFGRSISLDEASAILRNPDRMVAVHPDWEARRGPAYSRPEPPAAAVVLEFRSLRRAR
jgi:hypothetical protein